MPRVHSDHSLCSAAIGCTAQAARSVSALTSLRPMKRTLPSSTSSAIPPTVSSIGTSGVAAVHVVEVDVVDAEPAQRRLAGLRAYSGLESTRRGWPSSRTMPNFVASTTSSRRSAIAVPTSCSFLPTPYMSAVSRNVTPRSIARWIVLIDSSSSAGP